MRRHPQVLIAAAKGSAARLAVPRVAGKQPAPAPRVIPLLMLGAAMAGGLTACKSIDEAVATTKSSNVGARLTPTGGSAMTGSVSFRPYEGGITMVVSLAGGTPSQWRVVIHANGNCTSPNGFSAGPPLMLPGTAMPAAVQASTSANDGAETSSRLPGLALEGPQSVVGKSVVVHAGALGSLEAQPGVPNSRVACGVIEARPSVF